MLKTLKLLVHRFRPKTEIERKVIAQSSCNETEQREQCEELVSAHSQQVTATNSFETNEIRQRVTEELHSSDVSARQRDRVLMDKWFNRGDQTNSGSFNLAELQRRMEEPARDEEESIGALPAQEDILMAFSKPEFDMFEEEKISLSGVFLRVDPNEDFDEQYDMPLLTMHSPAESADHIKMLNEHRYGEEFNLDFSVDNETSNAFPTLKSLNEDISFDDIAAEGTLQGLISDAMPEPIPAFIPVSSPVVEERRVNKIDASVLFEEWTSDQVFDPASSEAASQFASELTSFEPESISTEIVSSELVSKSTSVQSASSTNAKPCVKLVAKPNDAYWSESDRLTRFGRRRTSASCSSTRLRALTQIA